MKWPTRGPAALKAWRETNDVTQEALAERLGGKMRQARVSKWEAGEERPEAFWRRLLREICGLDEDLWLVESELAELKRATSEEPIATGTDG